MFEAYTSGLQQKLLPREQFQPFPKYEDRDAWQSLPEDLRGFLIQQGEKYLQYQWPTPLASVYMDFCRNGNRTRYENIVFQQRRLPLQYLVAAECCEGKGRFIDDIINGVWTTLDEATWVIPAHNNQFPVQDLPRPLPDTENPDSRYIDLFAAECGAVIAWVYYMMGERLGQEAVQIPLRMLGELERRIFVPFLRNREFEWMGYDGRAVNNWNPWILSNILTAAGFACTDEARRAAVVEKCLECLEFFVGGYAQDGGCDEGPGYWNAAGASLFDCIDILHDLTGGRVDLLHNQKILNICTYIYKMQISGRYFVNYADASPILQPNAQVIYRMGQSTGDRHLLQMGAAAYQAERAAGNVWTMSGIECQIYRRMKAFFVDGQLARQQKTNDPMVRDVWFEGIQVMAARMQEGSDRGLYLSAKGGNNGESHNHNDVGSFVIYCDGKPAVIDIGLGVYEKKTFSDRRYEIPQTQSLYHNLPVIAVDEPLPAGCRYQTEVRQGAQIPGIEYAAQQVHYTCAEDAAVFELELKGAYSEWAGIRSWKRRFTFDRRSEQVVVEDNFSLEKARRVGFVLMTPVRPLLDSSGMTIAVDQDTRVKVRFDTALVPEVELFDTSKDARLHNSWGDQIYRTVLKLPDPVDGGSYRLVFTKV